MVDPITERIYNDLVRSFPPTASYSLSDLAARSLRGDLYRYLSFVIEEKAENEIENVGIPDSSWFDYSDPAVKERWSDFVVALKKHPVFPADAWATELHNAINRIVCFVINPIEGMETILFDNESTVRSSVVDGKLKRLNVHERIVEITVRVVQSQDQTHINRSEFRSLVEEGIQRATSEFSSEDWESLASPVFDLVSSAVDSSSIPVEVVTSFFDDIGVRHLADRIHAHAERYRLTEMDPSQFSDALVVKPRPAAPPTLFASAPDQVTDTPTSPAPASRPPAQPNSSLQKDADTIKMSPNVKDGSASDGKPAPLWKTFQTKLNAPVTETHSGIKPTAGTQKPTKLESFDKPVELPPHKPSKGALSDYSTAESPNVPIWERFRSKDSDGKTPEDFSAAELRVLGESVRKNRQRYVTGLFGGSQTEYETVIRQIDQSSNWDEASLYIADAVFRKHRVNIYSELAVSFTNAVEQRYRAIQTD